MEDIDGPQKRYRGSGKKDLFVFSLLQYVGEYGSLR